MTDPVTTAGFSAKIKSINLRSLASVTNSPATPISMVEPSYMAERPYRDYQLKQNGFFVVSPSIYDALEKQLDFDGFNFKRGMISAQASHQAASNIYSKIVSSLSLYVFPADLSVFDLSASRNAEIPDIFGSNFDTFSDFNVRRLSFRNAFIELLASLDADFIDSFYVYFPQQNDARYILINKKNINGESKIVASISDVSIKTLQNYKKNLKNLNFLEIQENFSRISTPISRPITPRVASPLTAAMSSMTLDSPGAASPTFLTNSKNSFFLAGKSEITQFVSFLEMNLPPHSDVPYLICEKEFYFSGKFSCPFFFDSTKKNLQIFGIEILGKNYINFLKKRNEDTSVNMKRLPIPMNSLSKVFSALCDEYVKINDSHVLEIAVSDVKATSLFNVEFKHVDGGIVQVLPFNLKANTQFLMVSPNLKIVKPTRRLLGSNTPKSPTIRDFGDDEDDELAELADKNDDLRPPLPMRVSGTPFAGSLEEPSLKTPLATRTISNISFSVADAYCKIKL